MRKFSDRKFLACLFASSLMMSSAGLSQTPDTSETDYKFPDLTGSSLTSIIETRSPDDPICQDYLAAMKRYSLPGGKRTNLRDSDDFHRFIINTSWRRPVKDEDEDAGELKSAGLKYRDTAIGTFIQPGEGPVLYYMSVSGSWRGNSGAVYASQNAQWETLPWKEFETSTGDLSSRDRPTPCRRIFHF